MPSNNQANHTDATGRLWSEFMSAYPTESDCLRVLSRFAQNMDRHCSHCGYRLTKLQFEARAFKCAACHRKNWHTAGTFFEGIQCLHAWLGAIWILGSGTPLSANRLHVLAGISTSTANNIMHKLNMIMASEIGGYAVHSAAFETIFSRRSSKTPKDEHPRAELNDLPAPELDDERAQREAHARLEVLMNLTGSQRAVYELVPDGKPEHFDRLFDRSQMEVGSMCAALTVLELYGLVTRGAGDYYVRKPLPAAPLKFCAIEEGEQTKIIALMTDFVGRVYHGISRKFIQNYMAAYCCLISTRKWTFATLLQKCREHPRITDMDVRTYVSPANVKMAA